MIYVDGFVITGGSGSGTGSSSESEITFTGTAPAGVLGTPGIVVQHVTTTEKAELIEGIFEVPEEMLTSREIKIFDPIGALLGDAVSQLPTGSLQAVTAVPGSYAIAVLNNSNAAMPYTLRVVTTNHVGSGGGLAAAMPQTGVTQAGRYIVADPVDGQAVMSYSLEKAGYVVVRVYNISGRLVRTFAEDHPAGVYGIKWDGMLSSGGRAPSGIYLYRVTMPDGKETFRKTAILR